jgi:hypothetical protein
MFLKNLLEKNGCNVDLALLEWDALKTFVPPFVLQKKECTYLVVWKRIFIFLVIPFTNAKVERMFSRMNRVKSDWRNRLKRDTPDW